MKRTRLTSWIVFAGVLLLVACSGLSESLLAEWRQESGEKGLGKLAVGVDLAADPTGSAGLTIAEADKLAGKWEGAVAYSARKLSTVAAGEKSVSADVIGVGGAYASFSNIWLYRGGLITENSIAEHSRVALVSAGLAERLFAGRDVVGMSLRLMGSTFTIVGVYEQQGTILDWMTDNGKPDMLIPITTMVELDGAVKVAAIELEAGATTALTGTSDVQKALTGIGKQPSRYKIVNYVAERNWVGQKPKLLLAAAGVAALVLCARLVFGRIKRSAGLMRRGTAADDWPDAVRRYRKELAFDTFAIVSLAICATGVWLAIRYKFYIPAELVPDVLIDWTFYRDIWLEWWREQVNAMGYVASPGELMYERVNMLVSRLTAVGILLGLPLLWIGTREWSMLRLAADRRIVRLSLYFVVALFIAAAAARWAGTDYEVRWRELVVLGSLFGLAALAVPPAGSPTTIRKGEGNDVEQNV
ncbi:ABC transporter permease [Paenibacillus hemerocallicola]|uniref:ABC transporter permease n=1 Tax=Paenibacillus hemerocallicola TaxID=1172614 RepID=A0A5C4T1Q8_9BACL|nr:ABC transporter permease [Paenibacillus hemerocallicola]TNJ62933.1 ABC transporter permease [Paenibacillus hemerocallicola]